MANMRKFIKADTLTKEDAATILQSFNRGKTTRKHTKKLQLYKKLPDDLQSIVNKKYNKIDILKKMNTILLIKGAIENDLEKVKYALDHYGDINGSLSDYIELESEEEEEVLDDFPDLYDDDEERYKHYFTVLEHASERGNTEIVKYLIENKVDVNKSPHKQGGEWYLGGDWALLLAARQGETEILKLLLDAGANINVETNGGDNVENFDDGAERIGNMTAFDLAAYYGHKDLLEYLIEKFPERKKNLNGAVVYAAWSNNKEAIITLINAGANINNTGPFWDFTALYVAVWEGSEDMVEFLIENGANIEAKSKWGETALDYANNEMVKFLKKAQKKKQDKEEKQQKKKKEKEEKQQKKKKEKEEKQQKKKQEKEEKQQQQKK